MYSFSHRAFGIAFGARRTHFLVALKVMHVTWLGSGRGHHPVGLPARPAARAKATARRLRSLRRSRERPARPDHRSLLPACVLCLAAARHANRHVAPGPPTMLCLHLALPRCGRGRAGSRIRVASGCARHRSVDSFGRLCVRRLPVSRSPRRRVRCVVAWRCP